jgi:hypothetical protein
VQALDENDRAQFDRYGINPDRAFAFGSRPLRAVTHWMEHRSDISPARNLRPSPFGGYAASFSNDGTELSFYVRFTDSLDPKTRSDHARPGAKRP